MLDVRTGLSAFAAAALLAACGGEADEGYDNNGNHPNPPVLQITKVEGRYHHGKEAPAAITKAALHLPQTPARTIHLPALDAVSKAALDDDSGPGAMLMAKAQAVAPTDSPAKLAQALEWVRSADGASHAALTIHAADAFGIRLGLLVHALPDQALLHVYSPQGQQVHTFSGADINALLRRNGAAGDHSEEGRTWWSPDLGGDTVTLHLTLPAGLSTQALQLALPRISHGLVDPSAFALGASARQHGEHAQDGEQDPHGVQKYAPIPQASWCALDASCYKTGQAQRDAVARMHYIKNGNGYWCTGTLLNDALETDIPYLLTASHCVSSQTVANTLQTDWFFRSESCNASYVDARRTTRVRGATLLFSSNVSQGQDMALLALNDSAPEGTYLAGWDARLHNIWQDVYSIHHPAGGLAKITSGQTKRYGNCSRTTCQGDAHGRYYEVVWHEGTTQDGSSGAALFSYSNHVIGVLHGGFASCTAQSRPDYHGRLDLAFEAGMKNYLAAAQRPRF